MNNRQKASQYLSSDQQAEYLRRARLGDACAKNVLVQQNLRFVEHIVNSYYIPKRFAWLDRDDLVQAGRIGLLKAIEVFDPKKAKFSTCAEKYIRTEISKVFQYETAEKRNPPDPLVRFDSAVTVNGESHKTSIGELTPDDKAPFTDTADARIDAEKLLIKLKTQKPTGRKDLKYAEIIAMLYLKDWSNKEAADALGFSREAVYQKEKKALEIMRGLADEQNEAAIR